MLKLMEENQLYYEVFTNKGIYLYEPGLKWIDEEILKVEETQPEFVKEMKTWFTSPVVKKQYKPISTADFFKDLEEDLYKFLVFSFDDQKRSKGRQIIEKIGGHDVVTSGRGNFEVMPLNVSKGNGLRILTEHLNIPLSEMMVLGDSYNDLSMFEVAGLSVAMENADQKIKDSATKVTTTNLENGVAKAIDEVLMKVNK